MLQRAVYIIALQGLYICTKHRYVNIWVFSWSLYAVNVCRSARSLEAFPHHPTHHHIYQTPKECATFVLCVLRLTRSMFVTTQRVQCAKCFRRVYDYHFIGPYMLHIKTRVHIISPSGSNTYSAYKEFLDKPLNSCIMFTSSLHQTFTKLFKQAVCALHSGCPHLHLFTLRSDPHTNTHLLL